MGVKSGCGGVILNMYDIEKRDDGWVAIDVATRAVVSVNDVLQVGLEMDDADDLADLLNDIESSRPAQLN